MAVIIYPASLSHIFLHVCFKEYVTLVSILNFSFEHFVALLPPSDLFKPFHTHKKNGIKGIYNKDSWSYDELN